MTDFNDGGQAFPRPASEAVDGNGNHFFPGYQDGMSLRDWFAGMALQGAIAGSKGLDISVSQFAILSYRHADEMLKMRGDKNVT